MAVMIIQMGEILRNAMRTVDDAAMPPGIQLSRFWTAMRKTGAAIRGTNAGRIPVKTAREGGAVGPDPPERMRLCVGTAAKRPAGQTSPCSPIRFFNTRSPAS